MQESFYVYIYFPPQIEFFFSFFYLFIFFYLKKTCWPFIQEELGGCATTLLLRNSRVTSSEECELSFSAGVGRS